MEEFPLCRQLEKLDCGPACLQMIAAFYGRQHTLDELKAKIPLTNEGTSLLDLSTAAEAIGFRATGLRIPIPEMESQLPLPSIIHWYDGHFAVVYRMEPDKVYVADPQLGLVTYPKDKFKRGWLSFRQGKEEGIALFIERIRNTMREIRSCGRRN